MCAPFVIDRCHPGRPTRGAAACLVAGLVECASCIRSRATLVRSPPVCRSDSRSRSPSARPRARSSPINPNNRPTPLAGRGQRCGADVAARERRARTASPRARPARAWRASSRWRARSTIALGADQCYRPLSDEVKFANQANQPGNNPACVATVGTAPNGTPVGHSYHGWGKAVDLTDAGQSLTFASPGYAFMKQVAGSLGWNHPAFAEPGGSTCPEPWHWEWVGDGGNLGASPVRGDAVALLPSADDRGYATVDGLGGLVAHGNFVNRGSAASTHDRVGDGRRGRARATAAATGWSAPTAACSASATRTSTARPAGCRLDAAGQRDRADEVGQGLLAPGLGRRRVQLRRRALLRLDGRDAPELPGRRHGADAERQGLLARRERRRRVQLRRRALLRLDRRRST